MNVKPPIVVCVMGPTAAGKTALALELVQRFPCDIVSVDSALVYRGMDIGTAKPTPEIQAIAPHRLIDLCDPSETYSVGQFLKDAQTQIDAIHAQGRIPLLVGGTMLYFHHLQNGIAPLPEGDPAVRQAIESRARECGWPALHAVLREVDPEAAARIHPNDAQRIQRALEVYEVSGQKISTLQLQMQAVSETPPYPFLNCVLLPQDRAWLHENIAMRLQEMFALGFVEEVKGLFERGDLNLEMPSMRLVGYRQVWQHLLGMSDASTMRDQALFATRQFAKRQYTWLRKWQETGRVDCAVDPQHGFDAVYFLLEHRLKTGIESLGSL